MPGAFHDYTDETGTLFEAYVATPAGGDGPWPCVVMGHDWSGPNRSMRAIADRMADLGYMAFLLDVYGKGVRGEETGDNHPLMDPLLADRALLRRRLLTGFAAARSHPAADAARMAAMGYCFGGLCVLDLARAAPPALRATVCFHAALAPPDLGPQGPIRSRVLLLHGWEDPVAPPADVLAIAGELTRAGADWQLHAYGHALHAFTFAGVDIPQLGLRHDPKAERRSWAAMRAFLEEAFAEPA